MMQKRAIPADRVGKGAPADPGWLDVPAIADVELTSEDPAHPVEHAFASDAGSGWRAGGPGPQAIRLVFHRPVPIRRIRLAFDEIGSPRTQELLLRWSPAADRPYRDIVRQQYTFAPPDTTSEVEDYTVDLPAVHALELTIVPDIASRDAIATMNTWRVA